MLIAGICAAVSLVVLGVSMVVIPYELPARSVARHKK